MEWKPNKVLSLKHQIESGQYHVDSRLVAEALIRHMRQNACSNPARSSAASVKTTSGGPAITQPIHVTRS